MDYWNKIKTAALLGTQKQDPGQLPLPDAIASLANKAPAGDKEEQFLRVAALMMNYTRAGSQFPKLAVDLPTASEPEIAPFCSRKEAEVLKELLDEKYEMGLQHWLERCANSQQLVPHALLPDLLHKGKENKQLQAAIRSVIGNRGKWLIGMNPEWQYAATVSLEENWQTGKPDERKAALTELRKQNPALALEWLRDTWAQENANTRASLVGVLAENASMEDEPLLDEWMADKSQKVRDTISGLLFRLAHSRLSARVWEQTKSWIEVKKSSSLFSGKKISLEFHLPSALTTELKTAGLESDKAKYIKEINTQPLHYWAVEQCTEPESWLYQVLLVMPPQRWYSQFDMQPEEWLTLFLNEEKVQFLPALLNAALRHQDVLFAKAILKAFGNEHPALKPTRKKDIFQTAHFDLIEILPTEEKQQYQSELLKLITANNYAFFQYAGAFDYPWSLAFSLEVLQKLANSTGSTRYYYLDPRQLQKLSDYLSTDILAEWHQLAPKEDTYRHHWQQTTQSLLVRLELKKKLEQAFQ